MSGNPTHIQIVVAKNIKKYRQINQLSQEELAFLSGLGRSYVGCIERAEKNISINCLFKLSTAFKININLLLEED